MKDSREIGPKTALVDFREFCRAHGLKSEHIAEAIGMNGAALRFHLDKETLPSELEKKLRTAVRNLAKELRTQLPRRRRFFK